MPGDRIKILFFYTFIKPSLCARPVLPEAYGMCPGLLHEQRRGLNLDPDVSQPMCWRKTLHPKPLVAAAPCSSPSRCTTDLYPSLKVPLPSTCPAVSLAQNTLLCLWNSYLPCTARLLRPWLCPYLRLTGAVPIPVLQR